jgi:dipeptidyl-peptidase 4
MNPIKRYTILLVLITATIIAKGQDKLLKLEDIWSSRQFYPSGLSEVRSMKDGIHYTELSADNNEQFITKNDFRTGRPVDTLFRSSLLKKAGSSNNIEDYQLSEDENKLILSTESEAIYRHSTKANNFVFEISSQKLSAVSTGGKQQYATLSPDGNMVAFVRDNNLYLKILNSGEERQVTTDGKKNEIINGATDWVYEEEFSFDQAYQWSSNGKFIAYYKFDESSVKEFNLTYYGSLYPKEEKYKYPKAGEDNSKVEIYIYDTQQKKSIKADVNKEADQYIPRIKWMADMEKLCVMRLNRLQNKLELYSCSAADGKSTLFFTETNKSYLEISDDLTFLKNRNEFIWTSTSDGNNHIYLHSINGDKVKQLTKGNWDVMKFYGYDEQSGNIYFQAAVESPMEPWVYSTTMNGKMKKISQEPGTNTATFSNNYKYYFITNSAIDKPYKVSLYSNTGKLVRVIEENTSTVNALKDFRLSKPEFFKFLTSENISLNGWMIKPPDFNPVKKYPVIQYMYGGPNSQTVKNSWMGPNYLWFQLLAQKGYIIVSVDNRGTGGRGEAFNKCTYKDLGHLETIDQIETAKWLGKQTYVDASRIGAWGWSYGGYMTTLLMTKGADFFKAAVAVAPVTNWRYYDSIYTERYLQTPQLNPKGYDENSPINFTDLLKGKLLIIHGTSDDNVHFQNSMEFVTALVKNKKQAETFFYPNKAHGLSGVKLHLYDMMTTFFEENL